MKLNVKKWDERREQLEEEIRKLKGVVMAPGHMGTTEEWGILSELANEATGLYMLRAELRNRLHCKVILQYVPEKLADCFTGKTLCVPLTVDRAFQKEMVFGTSDWYVDYLKPEVPQIPEETDEELGLVSLSDASAPRQPLVTEGILAKVRNWLREE